MDGVSRVSDDTVGVDDDEFCGEIVQLKFPGASKPSKPYAVWVWTVCGPIVWIVSRNDRDTYYIEDRETAAETPKIGKHA